MLKRQISARKFSIHSFLLAGVYCISIHVISTIGYITNSQWPALQLAWKVGVWFPDKPEFFSGSFVFFNRLGSFFCEDHYVHILKLRAPLPPFQLAWKGGRTLLLNYKGLYIFSVILWNIEQLYEYFKAVSWKFCLYFPLKIICSVRITHCWLEFLRIYILFSDFQGRIQEFLIGGRGGPNFGSERTVELFCGKFLLTARTTCFSICERRSSLAWKILLCEQRRTDHRRVRKSNYIFEYPWNSV